MGKRVSLAKSALVIVGLVLSLAASGIAAAQTASPEATPNAAEAPPTFAIYPKETGPSSYFKVTQKAGSSAKYTVVLANGSPAGSKPFKGRTFATDVVIKTNGGLGLPDPVEASNPPAAWMDYPVDEVTLDAGKGQERTFEVKVPKDAAPGQYAGALVFETAEPIAIPGIANLKQNLRQIIAFVLTVPGPVSPSFSITDVHLVADSAWNGIQATIVNSGNIVVRPAGKVTVSDASGNPIATQDMTLNAYYAYHSGLFQAGFASPLPKGDYLITIELRDPATGATAVVENQKVTSMTQGEIAAAAAPPINFSALSGELKPSVDKPQFLNVSGTVTNSGDPVDGAELSIAAYKDGKLVENYVLVSPLALPKGDTNFSSRYIPADGWSKGTWTFKLSVQVRDPQSGVAKILNTAPLGGPMNIP